LVPPLRGGTRWRRTGVVLVPALITAAVLVVSTFRGGLPLNLAVSGQDLKLTSNGAPVELPDGLTLYPSTIQMKNDGATRGVVIAGLPRAVLTKGLCISLVLTFPTVGTWTVRLHTSGRTTATSMTLDAAGIVAGPTTLRPGAGRADLPIAIGKSAAELNGVSDAPADRFGIEAPGAGSLSGLRADAQGAIIAGRVSLAGLRVQVKHGRGPSAGECY